MTSSAKVLETLGNTDRHGLLTLTNPDTRIEVLLVWLVLSIWVANLFHEVVLLVEDIVANTSQVGVLQIGIEVDLNDTV